jgi:type IV pilus assembly protein PilY1
VCTPQLPLSTNGYATVTCGSTGGTSNTLADVAEYYYKTDLRTEALGNCTGGPISSNNGNTITNNTICGNPDTTYNNVPTSGVDLNSAQHMTTFTMGLGSSGFMQYSANYLSGGSPDYTSVLDGTTAVPSNGVCAWQNGGDCNWPFPLINDQSGVDDLWHAGVDGRGSYFSATNPASLSNSLTTALASISSERGSSSGAVTSSPNITAGNNFIFSSTFATSTWDGDITRQQLNPVTDTISSTVDWDAQSKLDTKCAATDSPCSATTTADRRLIYTFDSGSSGNLKEFSSTNYGSDSRFNAPAISTGVYGLSQFLCTSPAVCLTSAEQSAASGAALVNYLRGDHTNEGALTDNTKYFRSRSHVLGDIVDSTVVFVGAPQFSYGDPGYSSFAAAQANRLPVVYVGANDGMLHAFRAEGSAATEAAIALAESDTSNAANVSAAIAAQNADVANHVDGGQEIWAYIPSILMSKLYLLADKNYSSLHRNFVDGQQEVADICVSNCSDNNAAVWKTILVGGFGNGGRGYYALDITNPLSPQALWEYTDSNLGYTYGNPQIAKQADGTWVVAFTSGYNNVPNSDGTGGDGQGRLYVLNAATGAFIRSIPTGVGNTSSPSGMSKIVAEVVNSIADSTIQAIYGGDLEGNLWRFDINNNVGAAGYDAQLLASLTDASGNPQPMTGKPAIGIVNGYNVLYVGTGAYLAASDINTTSTQSFYAIKDPLSTNTTPNIAIYPNPRTSGNFVQQIQTSTTCPSGTSNLICTPGDMIRTTTDYPVNFATGGGWYLDLPVAGERAYTDPTLAFDLVVFSTNVPVAAACNLGGYSFLYALDYQTGGSASSYTGVLAGNQNLAATSLGKSLSSSPAVFTMSGINFSLTTSSSGGGGASSSNGVGGPDCSGANCVQPIPTNTSASSTRRTSWRELITQ